MLSLTWYPVVRFPVDKDLSTLLDYLRQEQIVCRVTEEQGQQQLWISDEPRVLEVAEVASRWVAGDPGIMADAVSADTEAAATKASPLAIAYHLSAIVPVTLVTILLGLAGLLVVMADMHSLRYAEPFFFQATSFDRFLPLESSLAAGHYWRLFTPALLHFGPTHFIFNALFVWVIGRRIELAKGSWHFFLMLMVTALVSNFAQYFTQPNTYFGGLSGVVYGVVGYVAIYQRLIPYHPVLQFNEAAIMFLVVWLLLGVFGLIDPFIDGHIANAAHVSGLLTGVALGAMVAFYDRGKNSTG